MASGYGYVSLTEPAEVTGAGIEVLQRESPDRCKNIVPLGTSAIVTRTYNTELTEVLAAGMNVAEISHKLFAG